MSRFDEIPAEAPVVEARNAVFWLHDGVVFGKHLPDQPGVTLDDAIRVFHELRTLTGGVRVPMMFDGRGLGWLNIDARGYIRAHTPEVFTRAAIVVKHELVRLLSHAFLGTSGLDIPLQLFTDEEEAWQFLAERSDAA